jgi:hypothetical protein
MSTSLKCPDGLKDAECEKGQLSHRPPIPYVPVVDNLNFSRSSFQHSWGNNKEYLAHIVTVLCIIKQKGLPKKCRVLAKAVVRRSEALKNL